MATKTIKMVFQFRRDTTANWLLNKDTIPAAGEPCFDIELNTLKIGDGVTTYENLEPIGGVKIDVDGKSLVFEDGVLELAGFASAEVGAQPRKNANGEIEWVVPSTDTVDGLQSTVAGLQSDIAGIHTDVDAIKEQIETFNGDETVEGSIKKTVNDGINEWAATVTDDGKVNTVKELIDFVNEHGEATEGIVNDINDLKGLVGDKSVAEQIHEHEQKASKLYEHVRYEITSKPKEALVNYRDNEIRIMCPANTQWAKQNVGENGNANMYYVGFKAYAPADAVSFKEDLQETIVDQTMFYFTDNDFAGVDAEGRKYSICWLAMATYDEATDTWTYFGAQSTKERYIGWYYSVEWYNADGVVIDSDCIRINITNEDCHSTVEPYYMAKTVKGIKFGDSLLDMVDGVVSVPAHGGLQSSDEIVVNEDGTLEIGVISIDKLVSSEDGNEIIFDGGSASN